MRAFWRAWTYNLALPSPKRMRLSARRFYPPREKAMKLSLFPLVGVLEGLLLLGVWLAASAVWPPLVAVFVVWALSLWIEWINIDGMADSADALFLKRKPADALAIFKDPRLGVLATLLVVTVATGRFVILLALCPGDIGRVLFSVPMLALFARAVSLYGAKPAYPASLTGPLAEAFTTGWLLVTALPALVLTWVLHGLWVGTVVFATAVVIGVFVRNFGHRRLEGVVGDLLGLSHQIAWQVIALELCALG